MALSSYEHQYMSALIRIFESGFQDGVNERTKMSIKRLPGVIIQVDVEKEFPILQSKFVAAKTAQREIEWIWKQQSNNIQDLKAHIWDEWADENGSIGKAYGYQMNKPVTINVTPGNKSQKNIRKYRNQAEFVLEYLREFPNGRWAVATIWDREELYEMNLVPCCHTSTWNLDGGRLNCVLDQRSGDMPYGVPFNTTQYAELMIMLARDLGVKPGILTHVIADAHIYDNQMSGVELQIQYYHMIKELYHQHMEAENIAVRICKKYEQVTDTPEELLSKAKKVLESKPQFKINSESTEFFSYTADDCEIEDYKYMDKIDFGDVAV